MQNICMTLIVCVCTYTDTNIYIDMMIENESKRSMALSHTFNSSFPFEQFFNCHCLQSLPLYTALNICSRSETIFMYT